MYRCKPFPQESVVDTTGAGDSFHGAFLARLVACIRKTMDTVQTNMNGQEGLMHCAHIDLEHAAIFASAVASLNTQGIGGRTPLPSLESVLSLTGLEA